MIGFTRASTIPKGIIKLPVRVGESYCAKDVMAEFLAVDVPGAYNAIVGRPLIHDVQGVVFTNHLTMMYVSNQGTPTKIRGNQEAAKSCYLMALKQPAQRIPVEDMSPPTRKEKSAKKRAIAEEEQLEKRNENAMEK